MIGKAIQWHIERIGITPYKLAQRLMIGRSVVSGWVNDKKSPSYNSLKKIAKALSINVSDIVLTAEKMEKEDEIR